MIQRAGFDRYRGLLDAQASEAMSKIRKFSEGLRLLGSESDAEVLSAYAYDVLLSYGDNAAEIAASYYEELARAAGADVPRSILEDWARSGTTPGGLASTAKGSWDLGVDATAAALGKSVGGGVRRMAHRTMQRNAERDGARFARVTTSAHPCAFCIMLASRGFAYLSERTALRSHMGSYHDGCSCVAVASFDDEGLEGYQETADRYFDMWAAASESLPDPETRESWAGLGASEQLAYTRPNHPTWNPYQNYRMRQVLSRMRSMNGIKS